MTLGLFVLVTGMEFALRALHPVLPRDFKVFFIRQQAVHPSMKFDPLLGWALQPDYAHDVKSGSFHWRIRQHLLPGPGARGFRGEEEDASGRTVDIAVLGDLAAYGLTVDQQATWPNRLAQISGRKVINAAVAGYGTTQSTLLYRENVRLLRPKLVLLMLFPNDPQENLQMDVWRSRTDKSRHFRKTCMLMGLPDDSAGCRLADWVGRQFVLGDILMYKLGYHYQKDFYRQDASEVRRGVDMICRDLKELQSMTRSDGSRLAIIWPMLHGSLRFDSLNACAAKLNTPMLELAFPERSNVPAQNLIGRFDRQWNEEGHDYIAQNVHRFLTTKGLLAPKKKLERRL